jgi:hypothetical protein
MALEFDCPTCQIRMQTPDEAGGKKARCPNCRAIAPIPYYSTPRSPLAAPAQHAPTALPTGQTPNPFRDAVASPVLDIAITPNPYGSPLGASDAARSLTRQEVRRKLRVPAIGLLLVGGACLALTILVLSAALFNPGAESFPGERLNVGALSVVMSIPPLLMIVGAIAMFRGRSSTAAWAGSIAAVIPCCFYFPLSVPFGIWAIAVLYDPYVELVLDSWD